jgi:hypothetical protein
MKPSRNPRARPLTQQTAMKRRPFILVCALCSLFSVYCNRLAGGDSGISPATPHRDGSPCNNPVQCASFSCSGGVCVAPAGGLVEIDGDCSGGATCVGDAQCEQDLCVANSLACAADGTPCQTGSDCCTEECENAVCGFDQVGTGGTGGTGGSCSSVGDDCDSDGDCCSDYCDDSFTCSDTCASMFEDCAEDNDCCDGVCADDGTCA